MIGVIRRCLPHLLESGGARTRMEEMLPGHDLDLAKPENAGFYRRVAAETARTLGLSSARPEPGGPPRRKENLPSLTP
jgi:hypothetical protein